MSFRIAGAAIAFLLEFDDTTLRKYSVYSKDLVDFARSFKPSQVGKINRNPA